MLYYKHKINLLGSWCCQLQLDLDPWENQDGNNMAFIICVSCRWNEWVQYESGLGVRVREVHVCFEHLLQACVVCASTNVCTCVRVRWVRGRCAWCQAQTGSAVVQVQVAVRWQWLINRASNYLTLLGWDTGQLPSGYCGKVHLVGHGSNSCSCCNTKLTPTLV